MAGVLSMLTPASSHRQTPGQEFPSMDSNGPVVAGDSPPTTSEQRFLRYVQTGDTGVLDALVRDHIDSYFRKARAITGDVDQAEEAIQEAFLKLVRTAHKYDGSVPFGAWLGRLVCAAA